MMRLGDSVEEGVYLAAADDQDRLVFDLPGDHERAVWLDGRELVCHLCILNIRVKRNRGEKKQKINCYRSRSRYRALESRHITGSRLTVDFWLFFRIFFIFTSSTFSLLNRTTTTSR